MLLEHAHYRRYLQAVLSDRQSKNTSYSLRAFARDLGLLASQLSSVMNGKGHISLEKAAMVAARLGLSGADGEYFRLLVELEQTKAPELKATLLTRMRGIAGDRAVKDLSVDTFKLIADWYHFPIAMMTSIEGESFDPASVATRLGITKLDAEVAIDRLERLEMIEKQSDGTYKRWQNSSRVVSAVPNSALRNHHRQLFEKAAQALETQTPDERFVASETVAIPADLFPMIQEEIMAFRSRLLSQIDDALKDRAATEIYNLNLAFFRMTNPKNKSRTHEADVNLDRKTNNQKEETPQ